jgi:hypothetical protein
LSRTGRALPRLPALAAFLLFAASAHAERLLQPLAAPAAMPAAPWKVVGLPKQRMALTRFALVDIDGRRALRVEAQDSYGNLVHPLELSPPSAPLHLTWQWRVDRLVEAADLRTRAGDDTALKVCVFFDLPIGQVPFVERQLLRLARARSGEDLPSATVCYVWDNRLPVGSVLDNAYTRRVRYLVLRSGLPAPRQWSNERRDLGADFMRLFGDESPRLPAIVGIGIGADADNTHGDGLGHVAELRLEP